MEEEAERCRSLSEPRARVGVQAVACHSSCVSTFAPGQGSQVCGAISLQTAIDTCADVWQAEESQLRGVI